VQIALRFTRGADADLEYLPWEHLYLPPAGTRGHSYIATERGFAFTRARGKDPVRRKTKPRDIRQELSVLLVSSSPSGDSKEQHDLAREVKTVVLETKGMLAGLDRVVFTAVEPTSAGSLAAQLRTTRPDIIHYVGYGQFKDGRDAIALGERGGDPNFIGADTFAQVLEDATPRVVVLQLCDAPPQAPAVRPDLAPEVLGRGVDALVAYQYPAEPEHAVCFNDCFYKKVAAGTAVELAVQEGRRALALKVPEGNAFLAPTVAVKRPGGLRLTSESFSSSPRRFVGAGSAYG
jgi:hypothetical protein